MKNGEGRMFPLTPRLRAVLEQQRDRTRALERARGQIIPWLFHRDGVPIKSFRRSWRTACRLAGLPGKIPHDFRRTAVRNLERAGVPRSAAMRMVGHKTESVYRRYAIVDQAMLREAGDKVGRFQADAARLSPPFSPRGADSTGGSASKSLKNWWLGRD
jgi:integrase